MIACSDYAGKMLENHIKSWLISINRDIHIDIV